MANFKIDMPREKHFSFKCVLHALKLERKFHFFVIISSYQ